MSIGFADDNPAIDSFDKAQDRTNKWYKQRQDIGVDAAVRAGVGDMLRERQQPPPLYTSPAAAPPKPAPAAQPTSSQPNYITPGTDDADTVMRNLRAGQVAPDPAVPGSRLSDWDGSDGRTDGRGLLPSATPAPTAGAVAPAHLMAHYEEASRTSGIPAKWLIAKDKHESGFDGSKVGGVGELGIGQVRPSTAAMPGYGMEGVNPATMRDDKSNIMFSSRYLKGRGEAIGVTDWNNPAEVRRALTAYNGGSDPTYADKVMLHAGEAGGVQPSAPPGVRPNGPPGAPGFTLPSAWPGAEQGRGYDAILNRLSQAPGGGAASLALLKDHKAEQLLNQRNMGYQRLAMTAMAKGDLPTAQYYAQMGGVPPDILQHIFQNDPVRYGKLGVMAQQLYGHGSPQGHAFVQRAMETGDVPGALREIGAPPDKANNMVLFMQSAEHAGQSVGVTWNKNRPNDPVVPLAAPGGGPVFKPATGQGAGGQIIAVKGPGGRIDYVRADRGTGIATPVTLGEGGDQLTGQQPEGAGSNQPFQLHNADGSIDVITFNKRTATYERAKFQGGEAIRGGTPERAVKTDWVGGADGIDRAYSVHPDGSRTVQFDPETNQQMVRQTRQPAAVRTLDWKIATLRAANPDMSDQELANAAMGLGMKPGVLASLYGRIVQTVGLDLTLKPEQRQGEIDRQMSAFNPNWRTIVDPPKVLPMPPVPPAGATPAYQSPAAAALDRNYSPEHQQIIDQARAAVRIKGKAAVIQRLKEMGVRVPADL